MKILNIRQHARDLYTADVLTDAGQPHIIRARIDPDGTLFFALANVLQAGGYAKNPISTITSFINQGLAGGAKRKFNGTAWCAHAATEHEVLKIIRHSKTISNDFAHTIREIARQISGVASSTTAPVSAPAKPRRAASAASLADQAAGIDWLTKILADTTLPYSLHEQALRTRAGLLSIRTALQETI